MKLIMKFGGTSVGSVEALRAVINIVQKNREAGHELVVVASAMSGVTNLLIQAAKDAEAGHEGAALAARQKIEARHMTVVKALLDDTVGRVVIDEIRQLLDEFQLLCHGIHVLGELTPRALDVISGMGERMNVRQLAAIFSSHNIPAQSVDATSLIVTDGRHGAASPLVEPTAQAAQTGLNPVLALGRVPVVTGFIAASDAGVPTTLGRGGSDYSATILGRAIEADEVWIWTDVNGVMTTDPRVVSNARTVPQLYYAEVGELAYFGAKVLHPQAIRPARRANIPVRILNTFDSEHPGTLIDSHINGNGKAVKAITAIQDLSLLNVTGTGMMGVPGVAGRTFSAVARTGTSVLMISQSSSEQSICFVVETAEVPPVVEALREELSQELARRDLEDIVILQDVVILAVVGAGMKGTPGVSAKIFGALGQAGINVIAIAQGSSEYNISLVVAQEDAQRGVALIHEAFELGG